MDTVRKQTSKLLPIKCDRSSKVIFDLSHMVIQFLAEYVGSILSIFRPHPDLDGSAEAVQSCKWIMMTNKFLHIRRVVVNGRDKCIHKPRSSDNLV